MSDELTEETDLRAALKEAAHALFMIKRATIVNGSRWASGDQYVAVLNRVHSQSDKALEKARKVLGES